MTLDLEPDLLSIEDCARRGGISSKTLRREIADGKLTPTLIRGRVMIAVSDWQQYIKSCQYDVTARDTKFAFSPALDALAVRLRINGTRRNTKSSSSAG